MEYLKTKLKQTKEKIKNADKKKIALQAIPCLLFMGLAVFSTQTLYNTGLGNAQTNVKDILGNMIAIIELVFQAVGVVLLVYSIAQLVLAFKNEDADSKTRASTLLVVAVVLIALPSIIDNLHILDYIGLQ